MLLPMKLIGITVYPLLFEELIPSVFIIAGNFALLTISFAAGAYALDFGRTHKQ